MYPLHRENRENGKWPKRISVRENPGNLEICAKTQGKQGILFAQVVNSPILKVKDISKFASEISKQFWEFDRSVKSVLCM